MRLRFWLNNARTVALPQSVTPAVLAICLSAHSEHFCLWTALVSLVGIAFAHLSVNLLDDYFDYRNAGIESRQKLHRAGMRARIAKATYLAEGEATLEQTFRTACLFGCIAVGAGAAVFCHWQQMSPQGGMPILLLAGLGGLLGFFYSAKPLMLCYRGLGEMTTGIIFGPLLILGMNYASCGTFSSGVAWISIAVGLLVTNILYTHSIMDAEPDRSVGKKTLATLLATPKRMLLGVCLLNFLPYACVVLGVALGHCPAWFLMCLATLPMAVALYRLMRRYVEASAPDHPTPHWWMGPMANWDAIANAGLDWFMIRWYLSRNLLTFFVLILAVVCFL